MEIYIENDLPALIYINGHKYCYYHEKNLLSKMIQYLINIPFLFLKFIKLLYLIDNVIFILLICLFWNPILT